MVRVAAVEFTESDVSPDLSSCLSILAQAVARGSQLVLLPELTLQPLEQGAVSSADSSHPTLQALSEAARQHQVHIVVRATMSDDDGTSTSSALLFGADGQFLVRAQTQIAVGSRSAEPAAAVDTSLGKLGVCVGEDAVTMEQVRALALSGAQLVCLLFPAEARHAALHAAARAAENGVYVVSLMTGKASLAELRIYAPDGSELEGDSSPGLRIAELALPDGDALLTLRKRRKPDAYRPLLGRPRNQDKGTASRRIGVALVSDIDGSSVEAALRSAQVQIRELAAEDISLVVLPQLFCFGSEQNTDLSQMAGWFLPAARSLAEACQQSSTHVVTSLIERCGGALVHTGLIIGHAGIVARSPQVHVPEHFSGVSAARRFEVLPLPWGKLGLLLAEDALLPESARVLSQLGADMLVVCGDAPSVCMGVSLTAAALENGVPVAAALRDAGSLLIDPAEPLEVNRERVALLRGSVTVPSLMRPATVRSQPCLEALLSR